MIFRQLFDEETSTLTYILVDAITRDAVIIDPVLGQGQRDYAVLESLGANLKYIAETHIHADHVTGARALKDATGCKFIAGIGTGITCGDKLLGDGDVINFGNEVLHAISTPGHTEGCTTYRWRNHLFTGDALLIGACGRTDFQQGSAERLYDSLQKLLSYPDEYVVYPAHDYNNHRVSSIGQEKISNPYLMGLSREGFIEKTNSLNLPTPAKIDIAVPANMVCGKEGRGEIDTRVVAHSS